MLRRTVSAIMFILLLAGMLTLAFDIEPVSASGTIYIRADGSIDPPTSPISTVDNVTYILTGNITFDIDGIVVERDNIVVDGAGYTVQGIGASYSGGISLSGRGNVTIKNTNVRKFDYGIYLHGSIDCKVENITASDNGYGIGLLWESNQNILSCNNATNNSYGIYVYNSDNNNITSNTITWRTAWGIYLYDSSNNTLSGNFVSSGMDGILLLGGGPGNIVSGNVVFSNIEGIVLTDANNNTVSGNVVSSNERYGVTLMGDNNIIYGNIIVNNSVSGIYVQFHSNNTISNNTITSNKRGISLWTVPNNNRIFENSIMNNEIGIELWDSSNNSIYHNNLVNNTEQVYTYPSPISVNAWDEGFPSGGNYWSDYNGTDNNSDGIGDQAYVIDENNMDRYPLTHPYTDILGDINQDRTVDIYDAILLANAFGSMPGSSNWNSAADINDDNVIDIYDAIILAGNFGKTA